MKKIFFISILIFIPFLLFSQEVNRGLDIEDTDSISSEYKYIYPFSNSPHNYIIGAGAGFGRGYFGDKFLESHIYVLGRVKLNEKSYLRLGGLSGNVRLSGNLFQPISEDKAPYSNNYKRNAAHIGFDIELSPKAMLFVTAFFDVLSPERNFNNGRKNQGLYTYGFSTDLVYNISDNTKLSFGLTIIESNNPYSLFPFTNRFFNHSGFGYNGFGQSYGFSFFP